MLNPKKISNPIVTTLVFYVDLIPETYFVNCLLHIKEKYIFESNTKVFCIHLSSHYSQNAIVLQENQLAECQLCIC